MVLLQLITESFLLISLFASISSVFIVGTDITPYTSLLSPDAATQLSAALIFPHELPTVSVLIQLYNILTLGQPLSESFFAQVHYFVLSLHLILLQVFHTYISNNEY